VSAPANERTLDVPTAVLIARLVLASSRGDDIRAKASFGSLLVPCWRERQNGVVFLCRLDGRRITRDDHAANIGGAA
jgi:hypothetical protein